MLPGILKRVTTTAKSSKFVGCTSWISYCRLLLEQRNEKKYGTDASVSPSGSTPNRIHEETVYILETFQKNLSRKAKGQCQDDSVSKLSPNLPDATNTCDSWPKYNEFHQERTKARIDFPALEHCGGDSTPSGQVILAAESADDVHSVEESSVITDASEEKAKPMSYSASTDLIVHEEAGDLIVHEEAGDLAVEEEGDEDDPELDSPPVYISLPLASTSMADYVDYSPTLSKLVRMGVNLSALDKELNGSIGNFLIRLNFERDIQPHLMFIKDLGISESYFGTILTESPLLLKDSLDDIKTRVNYLKYRKFTDKEITKIVQLEPRILCMEVLKLDEKLGMYQELFKLTGAEVRQAIVNDPAVTKCSAGFIEAYVYHWGEVLGFNVEEKKKLLWCPGRSVMTVSQGQLDAGFQFTYKVMGLSHAYIAQFPEVLLIPTLQLRTRHDYLMHLGKAQYDPRKENFVPMKALREYSDEHFCKCIAKTTLEDFYNYVKTL